MNAVVLSGVFVGLVYGLIAVGLVVAYRGSRVINFAYGETGMLAAFAFTELRFGSAAVSASVTDHGLWIALPTGIAVGAALGALTEFAVVRPLRNAPRIMPLVGTLAAGSLLLTFAVRRWSTTVHYAEPLAEGDGIRVLGLQVQPEQFLIGIVAAAALVGLWALYRFTAFGLRLRATAQDPYAAGLVGVDVNLTSMATWALAGALAGISAILIAPLVAFDVLFMTTLAIRGLAAALVGGVTSIWGAFVAGIFIGVAEAVVAFKSPVSGITDVIIVVVVLVLLVMRPAGLVRSAY